MLKRGGKSSYNPYSTTQRVKKPEWKDRLDILPNRHSVWLKQVGHKGGVQLLGLVFYFFFIIIICMRSGARMLGARFTTPVRKSCAMLHRIL